MFPSSSEGEADDVDSERSACEEGEAAFVDRAAGRGDIVYQQDGPALDFGRLGDAECGFHVESSLVAGELDLRLREPAADENPLQQRKSRHVAQTFGEKPALVVAPDSLPGGVNRHRGHAVRATPGDVRVHREVSVEHVRQRIGQHPHAAVLERMDGLTERAGVVSGSSRRRE